MTTAPDLPFLPAFWPIAAGSIIVRQRRGNGRMIVAVDCGGRKAIVKVFPTARPVAETVADVEAVCRAAGHGLAPALIPTVTGARMAAGAWGSAYCCDHVEGCVPNANEENLLVLGRLVGRLHTLPPPTTEDRWQDARCTTEIRQRAAAAPAWFAEAASALTDLPECPRGFIHTDAFLHNCLRRNDGSLVLVDWDDAGTGPLVTDLAYACACLAWESSNCTDLIAAFADGYRTWRRLEPVEIACLPRTMLFWHLLYADFANPHACRLCARIREEGPVWAQLMDG